MQLQFYCFLHAHPRPARQLKAGLPNALVRTTWCFGVKPPPPLSECSQAALNFRSNSQTPVRLRCHCERAGPTGLVCHIIGPHSTHGDRRVRPGHYPRGLGGPGGCLGPRLCVGWWCAGQGKMKTPNQNSGAFEIHIHKPSTHGSAPTPLHAAHGGQITALRGQQLAAGARR